MSIEELKELKTRIMNNKSYLQEQVLYSGVILDSIDILISNEADEDIVSLWFEKVEREIEEIIEVLDIIENYQARR